MTSERVTRGQLPHWYRPGHPHFVTYRLAGSINPELMLHWKQQREAEIVAASRNSPAADYREVIQKRYFAKFDDHLDLNPTSHWLSDDQVAAAIRENLYHFHGRKYELLAYCIMPNHVHVVLQPIEVTVLADAGSIGYESGEIPDSRSILSGIMHSIKSFTANKANEILQRSGSFWQRESYDHWVRDFEELDRIVRYIAANPVRAGLCQKPQDWRYSSAHDVLQRDGMDHGLVGRIRDNWC